METGQSSPSKVKVEYTDPNGLFPKIQSDLDALLPLRNLNWNSQTRPLRSIESLFVDLVPDGKGSQSHGRPASQDDTTASRSSDIAQPQKERRHQIPGLRSTPYLKIYLLRCDDSDAYKTTSRKSLREWIKSHGSSTQAKGPNNQENHDAFEWLIVHIAPVEGSGWPTKVSSSVLEKIKSDFNGSSKSSIDRVAQIPCAFDIPGGNTVDAVTPGPSRDQFLREANRGWEDLATKFKGLILSSFDCRVRQYEEDIREKGAQRNIPGWNFCTFFVLKEGLARGFESVGLLEDALMGYDELAIELLSAMEAEHEKAATGEGASLFQECTKELQEQANVALTSADDSTSTAFKAMILDAEKKPYRELILANNISVFEFRSYVFARQISVLSRIASQTLSPRNERKQSDPAPLSEICSRAISFIASNSRTMRQDLRSALPTVESLEKKKRSTKHGIVENMVSSWGYATAQHILGMTEDEALSRELELALSSPQRPTSSYQRTSAPSRSSSLVNRPPSVSSPPPAQSASEGILDEPAPARPAPTNQKKSFLRRLATQRAELQLICRNALTGIGERKEWYVGWKNLSITEGAQNMDEISLDTDTSSKSETNESSSVPEEASFNASILGEPLRSDMATIRSFHDAYESLSWLAHNLYKFAGDDKSLHAMIADVATLRFGLKDYELAASYFHQLAPYYADQNWTELEVAILDMYARCLKGLDKPEDFVRIGLKLLAKVTISHHYDLHLQKQDTQLSVASYATQSDPKDQIRSIIEASKHIKDPCIVHLRNYFLHVKVSEHIEHLDGADGFSLTVSLQHILPESFEATFKVRIISASEGQTRDIWLSSSTPVKIQRGIVNATVNSNVLIPDRYLVDKVVIQAEKITFQHDFAPKDTESRRSSRSSASYSNVKIPTEPIIVWSNESCFKVTATASPDIHLDQPRGVLITMATGTKAAKAISLSVKPATAGLRMYTSDAVLLDGEQKISDKSQAGTIKLDEIPAKTVVKVIVPFQLDADFRQIMFRSEVAYTTNDGDFETGSNHTISVILPLGVNVQDIFKSEELYSRFTISCSTSVPLSVLNYDVDSSGDFDAVTYGKNDGRCYIFAKQPMSMVYRITRKSNPGDNLKTRMAMKIEYQCLDEEILAAVQDCLASKLEGSHITKFRPLLISHLVSTLQEKLPRQDLELIGLMREIGLAPYAELRWENVLHAIPVSYRDQVAEWLDDWHKNNQTISLPTECLSTPIRKVTIPVDVPPMHILHIARLHLVATKHPIAIGEAVPAELVIHHTRSWAQTDVNGGKPITFSYELDASPDTWLIGGRRRATFVAQENEQLRFPVLLLPQHAGKLLLPTLEVTLLEEQGESGLTSPEPDQGQDGPWTCEVDYLSQGEAVTVVPSLQSTTVAMDLEGEQSWLVDAEASSRRITAA